MRFETSEERKKEQDAVFARARAMLGEGGTRLSLIVGILICIFSSVSVLLLVSVMSLFVDIEAAGAVADVIFTLLIFVLAVILVLPLCVGLYASVLALRKGRKTEIEDLFLFFVSWKAYRRGLCIILMWIGRAFPFWMLYGLSLLATLFDSDLLYGLVGFGAAPLVIWSLYTTGRSFPFLTMALSDPAMPLGLAMKRAKKVTEKKVWSLFVFRMRLFGKLVLSLFSVGVVTLLHVLPLSVLANREYALSLLGTRRENNG